MLTETIQARDGKLYVVIESLDPDRTRLIFQDNEGFQHWILCITTCQNMTWYSVLYDGWVVWELKARDIRENEHGFITTECFAYGKPRQKIPAAIQSHIPLSKTTQV
jgi:hypothetical protein